jgi:hypothetical protein
MRHLSSSRSSTATSSATTKATTETWLETTWSTTALLVVSPPVSVTLATLAAGTTTTALASVTVVTAQHAAGWCVGALGLDVCLRHDLGGKVEPFAEVVESFWGQGVVVPLP